MTGSRLQAIPRAPEPPQGDPALLAVDRVLAELRRGRAIALQDVAGRAGGWWCRWKPRLRRWLPMYWANPTLHWS
jgi:hypothetical protein